MLTNKWFRIFFITAGLLFLLFGYISPNWQLKLVFLPLLYIVVLFTRNNHIWYFFFEFAIMMIFMFGITILGRSPDMAFWCLIAGLAIAVFYLVLVKFMDTRGYPVKKEVMDKK